MDLVADRDGLDAEGVGERAAALDRDAGEVVARRALGSRTDVCRGEHAAHGRVAGRALQRHHVRRRHPAGGGRGARGHADRAGGSGRRGRLARLEMLVIGLHARECPRGRDPGQAVDPVAMLRVEYSRLAAGAPERRSAPDRLARELGAAARACPPRAAWPMNGRRDAALADRVPGRRPQLRGAGGRAPRRRASRPAGAGDSPACQSVSSASRLPTPAITLRSSSRAFIGAVPRPTRERNCPRDLGGVGADVREVRLDHRAPEPPLVAQREPAAVGELERESVPAVRRRLLVDDHPPGHAEVQPEVRPAAVSAHRIFPRRFAE